MELREIRQWVKDLNQEDHVCEARAFVCPDGITRVLTHDIAYWVTLDFLDRVGFRSAEYILNFSWEVAHEEDNPGKTPLEVWPIYFIMAIYDYYRLYRDMRAGVENDNIPPEDYIYRRSKNKPDALHLPQITSAGFCPRATQYRPLENARNAR